MTRRFCLSVALAALLSLLCGCDVHQWPSPEIDYLSHVTLRLRYDTDFWVWKHVYDPKQNEFPVEMYPDSDFDPGHPGTTAVYDNTRPSGVMDVRVAVYRSGSRSNSVAEYRFLRDVSDGYDCEVDVALEGGNYEVVVWSHLLEDADSAPFYSVSDYYMIGIIDENYVGNTDYRDGFRGRAGFDLPDLASSEGQVCEVEMRRPMGKFEFETIDLSEFLDNETKRRGLSTRATAEEYNVVISYPYYYPNGHYVLRDDITSGSGYRFTTGLTVTGESEASMGFDYVFINNIPDGRVQAQVSVYDLSGNLVSNSQVITIPIRRDHHTVLRGAFLTMNSSGGVGIDPDYDGDHNVTFP